VTLNAEAHVGAKVADDIKPPRHREPLVTAGKAAQRQARREAIRIETSTRSRSAPRRWSGGGPRRASSTPSRARCCVQTNAEITSTVLSR